MRGQNKRMRGRGGGRKPSNPLSRSYESNGPDVKVRGNASHVAEKYQQLARDAQSSGDRVAAENYLQHAEHYLRIIAAAQAQQAAQQQENQNDQQRGGDNRNSRRNQQDEQASARGSDASSPDNESDGQEKPNGSADESGLPAFLRSSPSRGSDDASGESSDEGSGGNGGKPRRQRKPRRNSDDDKSGPDAAAVADAGDSDDKVAAGSDA